MIKVQAGIFYNGNDIAWKRDVGEAKQVFNDLFVKLKFLIDCAVCSFHQKKYVKLNKVDRLCSFH